MCCLSDAAAVCSCIWVPRRPPSALLSGSRGTTAAALQGVPLVTAPNGAPVCCAWMCQPKECNLDDFYSTSISSQFQNHRAELRPAAAVQQQQRCSSSESHTGSYIRPSDRLCPVIPFSNCYTPGTLNQAHPDVERNLYRGSHQVCFALHALTSPH